MNTSRKRSQSHFRLHFTSKLHIHLIQAIFKTRNGESGNGNDTGNGERGMANGEWRTGNGERGTGNL